MGTSKTGPDFFPLPEFDESTSVNELLSSVSLCDRAESHVAYCRYVRVEAMFACCCDQAPARDLRVFDSMTNAAARLAAVRRVGQRGSESLVAAAIALVWRIPLIGQCLRDGVIADWQFRLLVSRTDLIEGADYAADVDAEIAAELRRNGVWSKARLKDMADRMIFRHDPDAVRRARQAAKDGRGVWTADKGDGMSELGVIASAEEVLLANAAIEALARSTCKQDPRTIDQRRSDAVMCRLQQLPFECGCAGEDCDADIPEQGVSDRQAQILLNVICAAETLEDPPGDDIGPAGGGPAGGSPAGGDSTDDGHGPAADGPRADDSTGFGPSSGDEGRNDGEGHEDDGRDKGDGGDDRDGGDECDGGEPRDSAVEGDGGAQRANRDTATAPTGDRPPGGAGRASGGTGHLPCAERARSSGRSGFLDGHGVISAEHVREIARRSNVIIRYLNKDPDTPLPTHQPADKYRPSAALDTFVRIRDGYCTFPGCAKRAWKCDIDHVTEFDHARPADGGQTYPCNNDLKCEFHHLLKTFGDWLDDLYTDAQGFTHVMYRTPEGLVVESGGHTNEALFPELLAIRFADPPPKTGTRRSSGARGPAVGPLRRRPRTEEKHARRLYERQKNREERALRQASAEEALAQSAETAHYLNNDPPF